LRSFPELLVDIRSTSGQGSTSSIADTTYTVLTYIETLPAYEKTVENLLGKSHSERSWLMGAKDAPSPVRSAAEEGGIVNLFVGMSVSLRIYVVADGVSGCAWYVAVVPGAESQADA
jgi:hypothetical protein